MADPNFVTKKTGIGGHSLIQSSSMSSPRAMGQNIKTTPANNSELPLPAIIGGAVGGLVLIVLVVVLSIYIWYRRKYPVRMVLGKDFQKFSNPAYNTKKMSSLQLTSEDPLASYDEPLEQINEGFMIDREERDSIFDDMTDGPRYLSQEHKGESDESGERKNQIEENGTTRQDSDERSTEASRNNKKAILVTSEESENFAIANESDYKSDEGEIVKQECEERTSSLKTENSTDSKSSYSFTNEAEPNRKSPSFDRINECETRSDNISLTSLHNTDQTDPKGSSNSDVSGSDPSYKDEQFEISNTNDLIENVDTFSDDNIAYVSENENLKDESFTKVNDGKHESVNVLNDTILSSPTDNTHVDNENDILNTDIVHHKMSEHSESLSNTDTGPLSDHILDLDSSENLHSEDQPELVKETDNEYEYDKEDNIEVPISMRKGLLDIEDVSDSSVDNETSASNTANDTFDTTDVNNTAGFNEIGFSSTNNLIVDSSDKDDDQLQDVSSDHKENVSKEVDLEVLRLGYDMIKQSVVDIGRAASEEKLPRILPSENLVLEHPPPTPTVIFDSIILEPDISSFENKFHSVPDVRVHRSNTIDADIQPERRRARTSLDNSLNATLSDSFQSLISHTNRGETPEETLLTNVRQQFSGFGEFEVTAPIESLTVDFNRSDNDDNVSETKTEELLNLDDSPTAFTVLNDQPTGDCAVDLFQFNPFEDNNVEDTEFSLVTVDGSQSAKDTNTVSEKDVQSDLTSSSESSSSRSWEMIEGSSTSLIDFNDIGADTIENTGTKLLKIEPTSFDFDNDSTEESNGSDEESLEVINEDESNA